MRSLADDARLDTPCQLRVPRELQARVSSLDGMMLALVTRWGLRLQVALADRMERAAGGRHR